jgi:hypothetical protein
MVRPLSPIVCAAYSHRQEDTMLNKIWRWYWYNRAFFPVRMAIEDVLAQVKEKDEEHNER